MTREEALNLDYGEEATNKLMHNYSESRTCDNCSHSSGIECSAFDINVPETFTCLEFKGETDGIKL